MSECIWKKKVGSDDTVYESKPGGQHSVHTSITTEAKDYKCGDTEKRYMRIDNDGNIDHVVPDCTNQILVRENGDFRRACCEVTNKKTCEKDQIYKLDTKIAEEAENAKKKLKKLKKVVRLI